MIRDVGQWLWERVCQVQVWHSFDVKMGENVAVGAFILGGRYFLALGDGLKFQHFLCFYNLQTHMETNINTWAYNNNTSIYIKMERRGQEKLIRQIMENMAVKFILNLPAEEQSDKIRLAYHYQKAYYYYIDEICKQYFPRLNPKKVEPVWVYDRLNEIIARFFRPLNSDQIMKLMSKSKPTCGAIILNQKQTKVLVVEVGKRLGFPKGGKNQNETTEDCAARETKEEVGLFIHNKINPNDKIQFLDRGEVPAIYYIVRNFDEKEEIKIDKNEIDDAFWMNITDVSRKIMTFTNKSRMAWKEFENKIHIGPTLSMEEFCNIYRDKRPKNYFQPPEEINPLLNFKFDTQRLMAVIKQPI